MVGFNSSDVHNQVILNLKARFQARTFTDTKGLGGSFSVTATFTEDLAISCTNNEGLVQRITLTQTVNSVTGPFDLTGLEFLSSVKRTRSPDADTLAEINVEVIGDPEDGVVELTIPEEVMVTLTAKTRYYDFNIRASGQEPDCLWIAPFVIEGGVSKWA